jgi:hypothetical protein
LIGDRAGQFTEASGAVLSGAGIEVGKIPPPSPTANACAEQQVQAVRADVTGRMLIAGERHRRLVPASMPRMTTGIVRTGAGACARRTAMNGTQATGIAPAAAIRRHRVPGGPVSQDQRTARRSSETAEKPQLRGRDEVLEPNR